MIAHGSCEYIMGQHVLRPPSRPCSFPGSNTGLMFLTLQWKGNKVCRIIFGLTCTALQYPRSFQSWLQNRCIHHPVFLKISLQLESMTKIRYRINNFKYSYNTNILQNESRTLYFFQWTFPPVGGSWYRAVPHNKYPKLLKIEQIYFQTSDSSHFRFTPKKIWFKILD